MSGGNLFLDTNVILFLLNGDEHLAGLLHEKAITVSFITELELLGYQHITETEHQKIEEFLNSVTVIDINAKIKTISTRFRRTYNLKLPDAIIAATAYYMNLPIMTADKDLNKINELNILHYEL